MWSSQVRGLGGVDGVVVLGVWGKDWDAVVWGGCREVCLGMGAGDGWGWRGRDGGGVQVAELSLVPQDLDGSLLLICSLFRV